MLSSDRGSESTPTAAWWCCLGLAVAAVAAGVLCALPVLTGVGVLAAAAAALVDRRAGRVEAQVDDDQVSA